MPGWTRRHVVAHVGYHARGLARLVKVAREGGFREEVDPDIPLESVDHGATLPAHALRYLFQHSAVHLNVEWRDLTGIGWRAHVQDLESRTVEISRTPMRRALEIWRCALALNNGAAIDDVPRGLSSALLRDSDVP